MATFNLGNVVGLLRSITAPIKKFIIWAKTIDNADLDKVVLMYYDKIWGVWTQFNAAKTFYLPPILNYNQTTPPISPVLGDTYLLGAAPTGVWVGKAYNHVTWMGNVWDFIIPRKGSCARSLSSISTQYAFNGTSWTIVIVPTSGGLTGWDGTRTYGSGETSIYRGVIWESTEDGNLNHAPGTGSEWGRPIYCPIGITNAQINDLIETNNLLEGMLYKINNPGSGGVIGGYIIVRAITQSIIHPVGSWVKNRGNQSFGWFRLNVATAGSVNSIKVNGIELLTESVNFDTDIITTVGKILFIINGNADSLYNCIQIGDLIILISKIETASYNGHIVTIPTVTGDFAFADIKNISRGTDPIDQCLEVNYDITQDVITSCFDPIRLNKMLMSESFVTSLGYNPIDTFRWNDDAFYNNHISDSTVRDIYSIYDFSIKDNIIIQTSSFYEFLYGSVANIGVFANTIDQGSSVYGIYHIANACYFAGNNVSQSLISAIYNRRNGSGVSGNVLTFSSQIYNLTILEGSVSSNVILHTGSINDIKIATAGSSIYQNILTGPQSTIGYCDFTAGGSIVGCHLLGTQSRITNITGTNPSFSITDQTLLGYRTIIDTKTLTASIESANGSFVMTSQSGNFTYQYQPDDSGTLQASPL